jgi:mRNA interferase MazF
MIKKGTVITVNLNPTKGSETGKIRPCVVVSNDILNARLPIVQVAPITAWNERKAMIRTNIVIESNEINGLSKRSIVDCIQTRPIDYKERMVNTLGKLNTDEINEINIALKNVFDL